MKQAVVHNGIGADSLASMQVGDSPSLSAAADSVQVVQISPAEMFGDESQLVTVASSEADSVTLLGDTLFQCLAVVALLLVIFFISRHRRRIGVMFGRMFKGRLPEDFSTGRRDEMITRSFLQSSTIIGVLLIVLLAVKYVPMWMPASWMPASARWHSLAAMGYVLAGFIAVATFEQSLLFIIGKVTQSDNVVGAIRYLKRALFALASIAMSPLFLMGILSSEGVTDMWNLVLIAGCSIFVFLFLKETLVFFIDKKIPIFLWILYLCAVEAFPLSLIWALAVRS